MPSTLPAQERKTDPGLAMALVMTSSLGAGAVIWLRFNRAIGHLVLAGDLLPLWL